MTGPFSALCDGASVAQECKVMSHSGARRKAGWKQTIGRATASIGDRPLVDYPENSSFAPIR
jgi:hypothetical protein